MAFDMGFNFRGTSGYVTDQAFAVPVLGEAYPHTYTNGNGDSINAGWDSVPATSDRDNTADPRIAAVNYTPNIGSPINFKIDLSSGSAPGAGSYAVDLAMGWVNSAQTEDFKVLDTNTLLIDGTNGGVGFSQASGHFRDATLADVVAFATWTGTTVNETFATTLVQVRIGNGGEGSNTGVAHFRLTLAETPAAGFGRLLANERNQLVRAA